MDQINETGTINTDKSKNMDKIHESGKKYTFEDLREIMRTLRSENGCPWDRRQTHESLIPCLEEEAGGNRRNPQSGPRKSLRGTGGSPVPGDEPQPDSRGKRTFYN